MRTFFALELEPATALQLADWRDRQLPLANSPATGRHRNPRPVPPANFHLTLAFIGELTEPALESLCLAVDEWLATASPQAAAINLDTVGLWPKPGIYWLGPDSWPPSLEELARKLRGLASASGGRRDRNRFQPHITLFRGCHEAPPPPLTPPAFTMSYRHFTLFESRQGKSGVSYQPLQDWPLQG